MILYDTILWITDTLFYFIGSSGGIRMIEDVGMFVGSGRRYGGY